MTIRHLAVLTSIALLSAGTVVAQRITRGTVNRGGVVSTDGGVPSVGGRSARVTIEHMPKPGSQCLMVTPNYQFQASGGAQPMPSLNRKQRFWAVLELKYKTEALWQDELTFTWYVMAKAGEKSLREAERNGDTEMTLYSFYTVAVRYVNIPQGNHMACVCLDPSAVDRYGEPEAVTVIITNKAGDELARQSEITAAIGFPNPAKWWEDEQVMSATNRKTGKSLVGRRSGLLDRSKTPFALINAGDYEVVQ